LSGAAGGPGGKRARKPPGWVTTAQQYQRRYQEKMRPYRERLERYRWVAFAIEANRRFSKIEGKAGPGAVPAMEELSAEISALQRARGRGGSGRPAWPGGSGS
jgi:hypothetical protein